MSKKKEVVKNDFIERGERVGEVCVSLAGHDAGTVLVIVGTNDNYVFVADGKTRKISTPKRKKSKHVSVISKLSKQSCEKIISGDANDSLLRREISRVTLEKLN